MEDNFIDIEKAIRSKNPRLLRWMPRFLLRYIKQIVHEEEANSVIAANEGKNGYEFSKYIIDHLEIKVAIEGLENIPKTGGAILTINHPLGGMDAISIITEVYPIRHDMKFVVNDLLVQLANLRDLFVGVNKHGSNSKDSLRELNRVYESDGLVFVFPAGLVSRRKSGKVEDLEWKKTFITRARKTQKEIIPVYVEGELSNFFYRLANIRTKVGVKANLEMFYLVDELFKQRGKTIQVIFGEAILPDEFDSSKTDYEWAQWVKQKTYNLRSQLKNHKA